MPKCIFRIVPCRCFALVKESVASSKGDLLGSVRSGLGLAISPRDGCDGFSEMLLPTLRIYPVFLGGIYSVASISMLGNPPHPPHPSRVGGMEGPVQPQAGHPVALTGLLLAKAQQGRHPKDVK